MSSVTLSGYAITKPTSGPTAAAGTASGSLDTAALYGYKVTYVTVFGETDPYDTASTVTTTASGSVNLTAIPISPDGNVIARKIYRTIGGGSSYLLLTTISDNTTTTYTDTKADGDLGAAAPTLNSAHSHQTAYGLLKFARPLMHSVETAITATGSAITDAYQLSAEYNIVATAASSTGVKLPELSSNTIGTRIKIKNNGANTVNIYPAAGQTINAALAGVAITLAAASATELIADLASHWSQT